VLSAWVVPLLFEDLGKIPAHRASNSSKLKETDNLCLGEENDAVGNIRKPNLTLPLSNPDCSAREGGVAILCSQPFQKARKRGT